SSDEVIILPDCSPAVEWGLLRADPSEASVELSWETLFEEGTRYFEVERSIDSGRTYQVLGEVLASETRAEPTTYQFTDQTPFEGPTFYRIKLYEEGIKYEYAPRLEAEWKLFGKVALYPNPAEDFLLVQLNDIPEQAELLISDRMGRVLLRTQWLPGQEGRHRLNLGSVPPGMYHYRLDNGLKLATGTLIIE
ncbi:MAG: T9SS type A sorting domain-containing protein, partial [Bacteroidota bacterium]